MNTTDYDKAAKHPPRWGYQARGGGTPSSIVIHTTSNKRATSFETEARFLFDSADVSAHFLVGKDGRVVQFLDPAKWQAWHAGAALPNWVNAKSIGIEHHVSIGEQWTNEQHFATTLLVRSLMHTYGIIPTSVETHRAVALPKGRKQDPAGWTDSDFYRWRATLELSPPPLTKRYRVKRIMISQRPEGGAPYAGELQPGEEVTIDKWYAAHHTGHLQDERGFVLLEDLEAI